MIRSAVANDKAQVIRLLQHSRAGAGFDSADGLTGFCFPFDPAYAERLFMVHQMPRHVCLVHDVEGTAQGVLMAAYAEHPFGPVRLARETVWWIEPEYRGLGAVKMLDAYELWARANRCAFIGMAGMGDDPDVGRLYQRRGYLVAERHYLKAI
ncbi:MAG: GNAT family N-acetyltransferase [Tardiphaga sp.]